jgi:O-acetyl-ADP-ribose deacetylase
VRVVKGDITDQDVDAIVNAANSGLMGGGGVDGAIHRKGGPEILAECQRIRESDWPSGLPRGKAVITTGGRLKARHVIHTVGPVWSGGMDEEAEALEDCYANSLALAKKYRLTSVAFPSISTGAYGYPIEKASRVALGAVRRYVEKEGGPAEVVFVLFSEGDLKTYLDALRESE